MIATCIPKIRQVAFFELFPDEKLLTGLLDACNYDYPTICKMAATCKTLRNAVYSKFIEIHVWQIRCNQMPFLTESIIKYTTEIENLKKMKNGDNSYCFFIPNQFNMIASKKMYLEHAERDKYRITNMYNEFRTLFEPGNPIVALFGGYFQLIELDELDVSEMKYQSLKITMESECMVKSFNSHGHLSFYISDQNTSIYELKISRWVSCTSCQIKGEAAIRTFNDVEGFSDKIDFSKKTFIFGKTKEQPLWTVTKILQNQQRETSNFALGQKYNAEQFQHLKEAVTRNYREIKARELEEDNL